MTYRESLIEAMDWLASQPDTIFIGQTVKNPGSRIHGSLEKVPLEKRIEFPVAEEMQLGASLGMALEGLVPVTIFPRFDFLLLAMNQLVNHIDKIGVMSNGGMRPRIIIRTSVGSKRPLDGGPQHTNNHAKAVKNMLTEVEVVELRYPPAVLPYYQKAYKDEETRMWLFVEEGEL